MDPATKLAIHRRPSLNGVGPTSRRVAFPAGVPGRLTFIRTTDKTCTAGNEVTGTPHDRRRNEAAAAVPGAQGLQRGLEQFCVLALAQAERASDFAEGVHGMATLPSSAAVGKRSLDLVAIRNGSNREALSPGISDSFSNSSIGNRENVAHTRKTGHFFDEASPLRHFFRGEIAELFRKVARPAGFEPAAFGSGGPPVRLSMRVISGAALNGRTPSISA